MGRVWLDQLFLGLIGKAEEAAGEAAAGEEHLSKGGEEVVLVYGATLISEDGKGDGFAD